MKAEKEEQKPPGEQDQHKEQLESNLMRALDKYDPAHRGVYQLKELGTIVRLMGVDPTLKDIETMGKQVDPTHAGTFTEAQLLEALHRYPIREFTGKDIDEAVNAIDVDNDGSIDTQTLKEALTEHAEKFSQEEFDRLMDVLDPGKTGAVKTADLANLIK